MNTENDNWPKHPNGENKTVGEMTEEERRAVFKAAAERFAARNEPIKAAMADVVATMKDR